MHPLADPLSSLSSYNKNTFPSGPSPSNIIISLNAGARRSKRDRRLDKRLPLLKLGLIARRVDQDVRQGQDAQPPAQRMPLGPTLARGQVRIGNAQHHVGAPLVVDMHNLPARLLGQPRREGHRPDLEPQRGAVVVLEVRVAVGEEARVLVLQGEQPGVHPGDEGDVRHLGRLPLGDRVRGHRGPVTTARREGVLSKEAEAVVGGRVVREGLGISEWRWVGAVQVCPGPCACLEQVAEEALGESARPEAMEVAI